MWAKLHARVAALALILIVSGLLFFRYPWHFERFDASPPTDFVVYLRAWDRASHGASPYVASDPSPYKYAPGILALVKAFPSSPPQAWLAFSTLCVLGLLLTLVIGGRYNSWKSVGLLGIGIVLSWKGILETLDYGQLEILILTLAVAAAALRIRHPVIAGLLAGTLPWFKLPWALLLLPLILTPVSSLTGPGRKPKRVRLLISGYFFSWFLWGAAVPSLVFGADRAMALTREWLGILAVQPHSLYFSDINQSAWITALRWMGDNTWIALAAVAILGGFILGCLTARNLKITPNREVFGWLSPWLVLTQLLNPLSWRWGSVFLVGIPFSIAIISASRPKTIWRSLLATVAAITWVIQLNPAIQLLGYHHWSDLHGYGMLTAHWLALLMLCLDAQPYWLTGGSVEGPEPSEAREPA